MPASTRAADENVHRMRTQQLAERLARRQAAHARELRRLLERAPQHEAEHAAQAAEHERDPPSVATAPLARIEKRAHRQADTRRSGHAHRDAREHDAADERRDPRSGFDDIGQRAGKLAAKAEPLHQPQPTISALAATPHCAYDGTSPMPSVAPDITKIDQRNTRRRP